MRQLPKLVGHIAHKKQLEQAMQEARQNNATPAERIVVLLDHWSAFRPAMKHIEGRGLKLLLQELTAAIAETPEIFKTEIARREINAKADSDLGL